MIHAIPTEEATQFQQDDQIKYTPKFHHSGCPADELEERTKHLTEALYLVDGLIAENSVNIMIGDSGLGKSPWAYQLAYAVAVGDSFQSRATRQGPVIYLDLENASADVQGLLENFERFYEVPIPHDLYIQTEVPSCFEELEDLVKWRGAKLVIIDSLFAFDPDAPSKNELASKLLSNLRGIAKRCGCAFLLVHHIKKPPTGFKTADLESEPLMPWLNEASGARSLINGTDTRIGFAIKTKSDTLVLRAHRRLLGDLGTIYLTRVLDEDQEPIGYRVTSSLSNLNPEQQEAFKKLPPLFKAKDAKLVYGKSQNPTNIWLQLMMNCGLIRKVRRGLYEKTEIVEG